MFDQNQQERIVEVPAEPDQIANIIGSPTPQVGEVVGPFSPIADPVVPAPEPAPAPQPQAAQAVNEDAEQMRRFKDMRKATERAQRERDEAVRRAEQYERMLASQNPVVPDEPEEEFQVPETDDLVDQKKLAELYKYQKKQIQELKRQQKAILENARTSTGESRFMAEHPDWQKVMAMENIQALSDAYPELARSVNASTDVYEKAKATYQLIKRFNIYNEKPYEADKNRAMENVTKPRPSVSISPQQGDSPLSHANLFAKGFTKEVAEVLRKEMAEAAKKY